jgi:hypothetical protein
MAESAEHRFLKAAFLEVLANFSTVGLFGMTEVRRKTFDLGCNLVRDWTFPLVGQVDWGNRAGLDKDLRTLFADEDARIRVLIIKDDPANKVNLSEILEYHRTHRNDLHTLRVFPVTKDFDASLEKHRSNVREQVRKWIATDILFNVVFGGLSSESVRFFALANSRLSSVWHLAHLRSFGTFGTVLVVLHHVATAGFVSNRDLARSLEISPGRVREALLVLDGGSFLAPSGDGGHSWRATLRGRVLLELIGKIRASFKSSNWNSELQYLLDELNCGRDTSIALGSDWRAGDGPTVLDALVLHATAAEVQWGVDLAGPIMYCDLLPDQG